MNMPKKVARCACKICGREFEKEKDALLCESQGYALPEFFEGMVVEVINVRVEYHNYYGDKSVIHQDAYDPDCGDLDLHRLPNDYFVHVKSIKDSRSDIINLSADCMRLISDFQGNECPICNSKKIRISIEPIYSPFENPYFCFEEVEMSECADCGITFLSSRQIERVRTLIAKKVKEKKWIVAGPEEAKERGYYFGL